ncbi:MAG TPA: TIGR03943 family protein [Anaerolineaceae bacterium]|nr:TIGR03943 family protein [Anaerolineaceae bacterium]
MNKTIRRLQGLIFLGWAFFLVQKIESGEILFYINQRYILLVFLGALAFLGFGLATLVKAQKNANPLAAAHHHQDADPAENGSAHHHPGSPGGVPAWGTLVLAVPLLLGLVIPSRPLGSSAMSNRGVNAAAPLIRKSNGPVTSLTQSTTDRSVLDWVSLFSSASDPGIYQGQAARVTGFVFHDPRLPKSQFFVSRFVITCCVADASALGILVDWNAAEKLPENGWVEVKGSIFTATVSGQVLPGIHAQAVETIPTPDQPYLFP